MDAVQFIKERNRMCEKYFTQGCRGCPLENIMSCNYLYLMKNKEKDIVSVVKNWSEEHPAKTVLQDLLEKYPKTILMDTTPSFCPSALGYNVVECDPNSDTNCEECWNSLME